MGITADNSGRSLWLMVLHLMKSNRSGNLRLFRLCTPGQLLHLVGMFVTMSASESYKNWQMDLPRCPTLEGEVQKHTEANVIGRHHQCFLWRNRSQPLQGNSGNSAITCGCNVWVSIHSDQMSAYFLHTGINNIFSSPSWGYQNDHAVLWMVTRHTSRAPKLRKAVKNW